MQHTTRGIVRLGFSLGLLFAAGCMDASSPARTRTSPDAEVDAAPGALDARTGDAPPPMVEPPVVPLEQCNGQDDDEDGVTDEGLVRSCGDERGECQTGRSTCRDGEWAECEGPVEPSMEICNQRDDDCDGTVDEEISQVCGTDVGACRVGVAQCINGVFGPCNGAIEPAAETCDGRDEDCDGTSDEDVVERCGAEMGTCVSGLRRCVGGAWGACEEAIGPTAESCNGLDDDCDGTTDEAVARACGVDVGACHPGIQQCIGGVFGPCEGEIEASGEQCDAIDNDCDGVIDEGLDRPCGQVGGACEPGVIRCVGGQYLPCEGGVGPEAVDACDGRDTDCDGRVDEDAVAGGPCVLNPGTGCASEGVYRACNQGRQACNAPVVRPAGSERCNGEDDDCDGRYDEQCEPVYVQVAAGDCGLTAQGEIICSNGMARAPAPPVGRRFVEVDTGPDFACGILDDGSVRCWGNNDYNQALAPNEGRFAQIGCGEDFACAIRLDQGRRVQCWGRNFTGQLNARPEPMRTLSVAGHQACALEMVQEEMAPVDEHAPNDIPRTGRCWGRSRTDYFHQALMIAAGERHHCTGPVPICEGYQTCNEVGANYVCEGLSPASLRQQEPGRRFLAIRGGLDFSCGLLADNPTLICWGEIGRIPATPPFSVLDFDVNGRRLCIVKDDNRTQCWSR